MTDLRRLALLALATALLPAPLAAECGDRSVDLEVRGWTIVHSDDGTETFVHGTLTNVSSSVLGDLRIQVGLQDAETRTLYSIGEFSAATLSPRADGAFRARFPTAWPTHRVDLTLTGCRIPYAKRFAPTAGR